MKNIIIPFLLISLFISSCEDPKKELSEGEKIIQYLSINYTIENYDTIGLGTIHIEAYNNGDRKIEEKNLKNYIDKTLNIFPYESNEWQRSALSIDNYYYNSYRWETPKIKVFLQSDFFQDISKEDKVRLKLNLDFK